ncbi:HU family DNA-binding protein [Fructilactobacillus sp. Tb1]|uniref:HU family DNA-binding protein n=1 Tax=Fructilactobacillus sp. Tb1 TaxID=3422304 RepID=UPI003D2E2197
MALIPLTTGNVTTNTELADKLATKLNVSVDDATTTLAAVAEVVKDSLVDRKGVEFNDLATFRLEVEPERDVRIVNTGKLETVPARIYPHVDLARKIKSAVEDLKVTPEELKLAENVREHNHETHRN